MSQPVTTGSPLSRPSGAEQWGNRGASANQMAPEAASGGHPGKCTLILTNIHTHDHTHALTHVDTDTLSNHTYPQTLIHAHTPPTHSRAQPGQRGDQIPATPSFSPSPQQWGRTEFPGDFPPLLGSAAKREPGEWGRKGSHGLSPSCMQSPSEALYTSSNGRFYSHLGALNQLSSPCWASASSPLKWRPFHQHNTSMCPALASSPAFQIWHV